MVAHADAHLESELVFSIMPVNPKKKLCPANKVIVLGSSGAGKTTLVHRLASKKPVQNDEPSLLMGDYLERMAHVSDEQLLKVQLWDTAGQGKFGASALPNSYFRHACGAILVYDVTSRRSFDEILRTWVHQLESFYSAQAAFTLTLVATKCDAAASDRQVTKEQGEWLAQTVNADHFFECSASNPDVADQCFNATARSIGTGRSWSVSLDSIASALKQICASKPVSVPAAVPVATPVVILPAPKISAPALTIKTSLLESKISTGSECVVAFQPSKLLSPSVHFGGAAHDSAALSWSSLVCVNSAERMVLVSTAALLAVSPALLLVLFAGDSVGAAAVVNAWLERLSAAACSSLATVSGVV